MNSSEQSHSSGFPFHRYCGYCSDMCENIYVDKDYLLVSNVWNEEDNIDSTFQNIAKQTKPPKVWLWIDDGSTDRTSKVIESLSDSLEGTEVWLKKMPPKLVGNLDTIGRAYDTILPPLYREIEGLGVDYVAIMDPDTEPCPNYYARLIHLMETNPDVGAAAGIPLGEVGLRKVGLPMGGGKIIRWSIVKKIKEYWDIAPDTLLNIKALAQGYELKTWAVPLRLIRLTTGFSPKGVYRQGRLNYYVGRPFWSLLFRALRRLILRQHGTQMLRGYFHEWVKGTWQCRDPDVREFYGSGSNPISGLIDVLRSFLSLY